jgi:DNA-binding CsgD family transcriptional regulator
MRKDQPVNRAMDLAGLESMSFFGSEDINAMFRAFGKLVSSAGTDSCIENLCALVNMTVRVDQITLSAWMVDQHATEITRSALVDVFPNNGEKWISRQAALDDEFVRILLDVNVVQPTTLSYSCNTGTLCGSTQNIGCEGAIIWPGGSARIAAFFKRSQPGKTFTSTGIGDLESMSDALFPVIQYQTNSLQSEHAKLNSGDVSTYMKNELLDMQCRFNDRLEERGVVLSSREYQVCIALLSGETLAAVAQQLDVKPCTAETYFRRASMKLNFSGRHGLSKWMLGVGIT